MQRNILVDTSAWMRACKLEKFQLGHSEMREIIKAAETDSTLNLLFSPAVKAELEHHITGKNAEKREKAIWGWKLCSQVAKEILYTGAELGKARLGLMRFGASGWNYQYPNDSGDRLIFDVVQSGTHAIDFVISVDEKHILRKREKIEAKLRIDEFGTRIMDPKEFWDWYQAQKNCII